jgi:hypothetical protein
MNEKIISVFLLNMNPLGPSSAPAISGLHAAPVITQSMVVNSLAIGLGAILVIGAARYGLRKIGVVN